MQKRDLAQFLLWIRYTLDAFPRGVECFFNTAIEDGMENVFLAFEVELDGAVGNACLAGYVRDLGIEVTVMREDTDSGAQNSLALIASSHADRIK